MSAWSVFNRPSIVRDWHDGDTGHVDVDLGFGMVLLAYNPITGKPQWSCRIQADNGQPINAPELNTDAGKLALAYAQQICPAGTLVLASSTQWDKYGGRWDGIITLPQQITVNGVTTNDFGSLMVASGNAVYTSY